MDHTALPAGTRLRGGALLIEEFLGREAKALCYRAYDVPQRRAVLLREFFPANAARDEHHVRIPPGWSAQGFEIARQVFAENFTDALFTFPENNTLYLGFEYSSATASSADHSTVVLPDPETDSPREAISPALDSAQTLLPDSTAPPSRTRAQFSLHDILPDALRGALQGAVAGGIGGVLLGLVASLVGGNDLIAGAARGLWAIPIGALAGAFLGALRALPSSAPQLATASPRTLEDQLKSTQAGAGKGALMGILLSAVFAMALATGDAELTIGTIFRIALLCLLCGAFAGAIVGFIRINPRDRSRR